MKESSLEAFSVTRPLFYTSGPSNQTTLKHTTAYWIHIHLAPVFRAKTLQEYRPKPRTDTSLHNPMAIRLSVSDYEKSKTTRPGATDAIDLQSSAENLSAPFTVKVAPGTRAAATTLRSKAEYGSAATTMFPPACAIMRKSNEDFICISMVYS